MSCVIFIIAVYEQAAAVPDRFNDLLMKIYRNSRASPATTYISLRLNKGLIYISGAVHYNTPVIRIIVNPPLYAL